MTGGMVLTSNLLVATPMRQYSVEIEQTGYVEYLVIYDMKVYRTALLAIVKYYIHY